VISTEPAVPVPLRGIGKKRVHYIYLSRTGISRVFGEIEVRLMCRSIKPLFNFEPPVTEDEIYAASLQFVRKISGFTRPSKANEAIFLKATTDIAMVSRTLLSSLETAAPPRNREEAARRARAAERTAAR
jgi:hypothetical protein